MERNGLMEPDRLEGFPHPRETRQVFGHDRHQEILARSFLQGHMHHAWLICGPEGIGKATLAYRFAKFALASCDERDSSGQSLDVSEDSSSAKRVRALSHPGLLVIRRRYDEKTKRLLSQITVDEVRRLRQFLTLQGDTNGWRIVVVDRAEEMNINAANAILKSLEEPPKRTIFLLITSEPGRLVNTIRSRCRTLVLDTLGEDDLRAAGDQAMAAAGLNVPGESVYLNLSRFAHGCVRRFLYLNTEKGIENYETIVAMLRTAAKPDWELVHKKADFLASVAAKEHFESFYDMLLGEVARLVRLRATGSGSTEDLALSRQLIGDGQLALWANVWETLWRKKDEAVLLNLDRKALLLGAVACLEKAACDDQNNAQLGCE